MSFVLQPPSCASCGTAGHGRTYHRALHGPVMPLASSTDMPHRPAGPARPLVGDHESPMAGYPWALPSMHVSSCERW